MAFLVIKPKSFPARETKTNLVTAGPVMETHLRWNLMGSTPRKINIEPENHWVVEESSLPKVHFQVPC